MPVKLGKALLPENAEARIEIVPLIDIMFFLLASFMLVSLSMVHALTIKVNLPSAATATSDPMKEIATVSIDRHGDAFLDQGPVKAIELRRQLEKLRSVTPNLRVIIHGDEDARHGDVIRILDQVRLAGVDKVGFDVREIEKEGVK